MDFLDFFWMNGRPGMFWVVQIALIAATVTLLVVFRNYRQTIESGELTKVEDYVPTVLLLGTVVLLILASFIPGKPAITNGLICMILLLVGLIYEVVRHKKVSLPAAGSVGDGLLHHPPFGFPLRRYCRDPGSRSH